MPNNASHCFPPKCLHTFQTGEALEGLPASTLDLSGRNKGVGEVDEMVEPIFPESGRNAPSELGSSVIATFPCSHLHDLSLVPKEHTSLKMRSLNFASSSLKGNKGLCLERLFSLKRVSPFPVSFMQITICPQKV